MFSIQFDACNREYTGLTSIGYALFYDSMLLWTHYSMIEPAANSSYAEYEALLNALKFAISLNIQYLNVQGDAKIVIDQINNTCSAKSETIKPLLYEVNNLKKKFKVIEFEHIYRKDNILADSLANQAIINYLYN